MNLAFTPRGRLERTPLLRPAPAPSQSGWLRFGGEQEGRVYLSVGVGDSLQAWAEEAQPHETMGILAGRPCEDAEGPYTLVVGAVQARDPETGRAHVFTDSAGMAELVADLRERFPIAEVVGWWHTHPGYGTRFSVVDEQTQATFTARSCVGLVVDPTLPRPQALGVYLGPASQRVDSPAQLPEEQAAPPPAARWRRMLRGLLAGSRHKSSSTEVAP